MIQFEWGGHKDNRQLVPRPSDPRRFPQERLIDKLGQGGYQKCVADCVEYSSANRVGFRLIAAWAYHRFYERWD
jgi:hypothetical protein